MSKVKMKTQLFAAGERVLVRLDAEQLPEFRELGFPSDGASVCGKEVTVSGIYPFGRDNLYALQGVYGVWPESALVKLPVPVLRILSD